MLEYGLEWHALDSYLQFKEIAEPATPQANQIRQYATDSGGISTMCWKNDAGNVTCLPTGGGTIPTGTGAAGAVAFWTSATTLGSDVAHFFWDDTNDQLLIGISTGSHFGTDAGLVLDENGSSSIIGSIAHSATVGHSGALNLGRSRGTHAAQTIVASGDRISRIVSQGYDGAAYIDTAAIDVYVDGTPGLNDMPGRLEFLTTLDGTTTPVMHMAIDNAGKTYLATSLKTHTGTNFKLALDSDTEVTGLEIAGHHTVGPAMQLFMSRGTHALPTIVAADDRVAFFLGNAYGGASYHNLAAIQFLVDGTPGNNDMPGRIGLFTTPDGSATLAERFRIGQAGQWGIGGATFGGIGDIFSSGGIAAPPTWVTRATLNAALDHGILAGLSDDDHPQYALLVGRAGGQTLKGGTAAADDLTLIATSGVGVGSENIFFGIGSNGAKQMQLSQLNGMAALGINMAPTIGTLSIKNTSDSNEALLLLGDGFNSNFGSSMFTNTANGPGFNFTKGRGSFATPTQTQAGDVLFGISGFAIDANGPPGVERGPTASIVARATQNITSTNFATDMTFYYVAPGTTTQVAALFLGGGQHVLGDTSIGLKLQATTITMNNITDFSTVVGGITMKFAADATAAGAYAGRIPIDIGGVTKYIHYFNA